MNLIRLRGRLCVAALVASTAVIGGGCARSAQEPVATAAASTEPGQPLEEKAQAPEDGASVTSESNPESQSESGKAVEAMTTAPREKGAQVNGQSLNVATGVVTDASVSTVTISTGRYPEGITFLKEGAAVGFADGLLAGHEITIFYQGEIKDQETSGVTVELLRDKREGDEEAQAAMMTGKIVSIGMSVVTIETEDGRTVSFEQDPKPVNMTDGPVEGEMVTIVYSYHDESREGAVVAELLRK